ncbi:hypothetical protein [Maribacter luteus]|uniref:Fibronectin type-III domain-containing protein n=1 Tax=Maribacter luteus TaxID=2594478 RepID=A0A6I2MMJ3_9FLAO|nr:hypothetical protein [Maribacter luteus]MRX64047.1 hypothetical protein [Maribacter luteus]|tara:strand:+ start:1170 stop:1874 length:705 start_codon:yes stop_codon:yes gene_type:complete
MKNIKTFIGQLLLIYTVVLFSCCSGEGGSEEPPLIQKNPPSKAVAVLPSNGEPCSDYEEVIDDDSKVLISFKWNAAELAQSYTLVILEGASEVFRNTLNTLETKVTLEKGRTYSWGVISSNEDGETIGDTFSFTTPGRQIGNFAPYTAEISISFDVQNSEMRVSWIGKDEDEDTLRYDIKILENETVLSEFSNLEASSIDPIVYTPSTSYRIEVTSKDNSDNYSVSILNVVSPD